MFTGGAKEPVDYYSPLLDTVMDIPLIVIVMMKEFFFLTMLTKQRAQFFGILIFSYNFYICLDIGLPTHYDYIDESYKEEGNWLWGPMGFPLPLFSPYLSVYFIVAANSTDF
jgi:hypothetical protein